MTFVYFCTCSSISHDYFKYHTMTEVRQAPA